MTVKQLDICSPPPAQSVVEDAEDLGVSAVALYACNWSVPGCVVSRGTAQGVQAGGVLVVPIVTPSASPPSPQAALSACQAWGLPCRVIMVDLEGPPSVDWPPTGFVTEFTLLCHQAGLEVLGYAAVTPDSTRGKFAGCGIDYWLQGTLNDEETIPAGWDGNQYTDALRGPVSGTLYDCSVLSDELWAVMRPANRAPATTRMEDSPGMLSFQHDVVSHTAECTAVAIVHRWQAEGHVTWSSESIAPPQTVALDTTRALAYDVHNGNLNLYAATTDGRMFHAFQPPGGFQTPPSWQSEVV